MIDPRNEADKRTQSVLAEYREEVKRLKKVRADLLETLIGLAERDGRDETLCWCSEDWVMDRQLDGEHHPSCITARAAIAKAEGVTPDPMPREFTENPLSVENVAKICGFGTITRPKL